MTPVPATAAGRRRSARGRRLLPLLLTVAAFALTVAAGLVVRATPAPAAPDVALYHAVNGLACGATDADPLYRAIWTGLNQPALNYYVLYGITFAYVLLRRREQWARLLVVTALIAGLGYLSNPIVWHWAWGPRPFTVTTACIAHPEWEATWSQYSSFPSGHARETSAELTALVAFWPAALLPAAAYMALLAFSRLYLGVHFPSDVLLGAALGWAIARIAFLAWDVYARGGMVKVTGPAARMARWTPTHRFPPR